MPGNCSGGGVCATATMRPASGKGSGSRSTALTTLKIAVFAPMPEGEHEDRGGREARTLAEHAEAVADVLDQ